VTNLIEIKALFAMQHIARIPDRSANVAASESGGNVKVFLPRGVDHRATYPYTEKTLGEVLAKPLYTGYRPPGKGV
jgi:hypothetical protein